MTIVEGVKAIDDVEMTSGEHEVSVKDAKFDRVAAFEELKDQLKTIERTVITKETHYILRILRRLSQTKSLLSEPILRDLITYTYGPYGALKDTALAALDQNENPTVDPETAKQRRRQASILPEIDSYLHLLIVLYFIEVGKHQAALNVSKELVDRLLRMNSRTLDLLTARCLFYWYQCMELCNDFSDIRETLSLRLMKSSHNSDNEGMGVCLNLYMRFMLRRNLYEQAQKLLDRFPAPAQTSNSQLARYLFYSGRIHAVRLKYTSAFNSLATAIRKAPPHGAIGFRQIAHKYLITVQLLMGEIPEKSIFRQAQLTRCLLPYKLLVLSVRNGDMSIFIKVLDKFREQFTRDGIMNLIIRLRHNVIRAGLRMISLSYSRISFIDIAKKLRLESALDAENVVSKAIRDSVIFGIIHKSEGFLETIERHNIYCTNEPSLAFDRRIRFCLDTHARSVKALRFPPKKYYDNLETSKERFEKEREAMEYAKQMVEDEEDFA